MLVLGGHALKDCRPEFSLEFGRVLALMQVHDLSPDHLAPAAGVWILIAPSRASQLRPLRVKSCGPADSKKKNLEEFYSSPGWYASWPFGMSFNHEDIGIYLGT